MGSAPSTPSTCEDLIRSYQADYSSDHELQELNTNFTARANDVRMSSGVDRIKQCVLYLRNSDEKAVERIMSCKTEILAAGGNLATEIKKFLDKVLILQYLENSKQTLTLLEVHLLDFIKKAEKVVSCIKDCISIKPSVSMVEEFNKAKNLYHLSAKTVVEKVVSLQGQHLELLNILKTEFKKLDKKLRRIRILRKFVQVIFMGILSAGFAFGIMAAAMVAIPGIAAAMSSHPVVTAFISAASSVIQNSSSAIEAGQLWLLSMIRESEITLEARQNFIKSMESGTMDAIKVLEDIMCQVNNVIATGNNPQLSNLSSGNERPEDLDAKLKNFQNEIKALDETRKQCIPIIDKARDKVINEYRNLNKRQPREKK